MARTHNMIVAIGACAIDTILVVPHFPSEDSKLRARSLTKRRGGNCPNSLEVLQQLILETGDSNCQNTQMSVTSEKGNHSGPELILVATLPARSSPQTSFMLSSFEISVGSDLSNKIAQPGQTALRESIIDCTYCIHREDHTEPVCSYIISSSETGSRTIVNHNELEEMSLEEFTIIVDRILNKATSRSSNNFDEEQLWFHFEGRIPSITLACVEYLRSHKCFAAQEYGESRVKLRVSVELEKPGREGLQQLALAADVVFYSRSWAEGEGYHSASACLERQAEIMRGHHVCHNRAVITLICTWGEQGACALLLNPDSSRSGDTIVSCPAYTVAPGLIVDTVGAGDTFIAGMLFSLICRYSTTPQLRWSLFEGLRFANELAGRKIMQLGFGGLGKQTLPLTRSLDSESSLT